MRWKRKSNGGMALQNRFAVMLLGWCSALVLATLCIGCKPRVSSYEVGRTTSPNGRLEAILTETNGGGTTSFGYEVSIGTKGASNAQRVASLYGAVRNAQAYGVNLSWTDNHTLRIQYLRAKAVQNVISTVNVNGQQVEVTLQSDIEDPNAPAGGMQYNLQKQSH
jgi:hypothetical protein